MPASYSRARGGVGARSKADPSTALKYGDLDDAVAELHEIADRGRAAR